MKHLYLLIIVLFCSLVAKGQYTLTLDDVSFNASTGTITDYTNTVEKDIVIPSAFTIDGQLVSVTRIANGAFRYSQLTSVVLPGSLIAIGGWAFQDNQLISVTFETNSNIRVIGSRAFDDNSNLTSISLPAHSAPGFVEYFDSKGTVYKPNDEITDFKDIYVAKVPYTLQLSDITYTLNGSELTISNFVNTVEKYIVIPSIFTIDGQLVSVTGIGEDAFKSSQLTSVTLPGSLIAIGKYAFNRNQLTSVIFEANSNIRVIGEGAFDNNSNLTTISLPAHLAPGFVEYFDGKGTVYQPGDNITDFTVVYAAKVPYTLQLSDIAYTLKGSELAITDYTNAVEKYIEIPSVFTVDGKEVSVTGIEDSAFRSSQLTNVVLPGSLITIGYLAFQNNHLSSVTLPNSLLVIGEHTFSRNQLTSVVLPNSLTTIGHVAFSDNKLTSVTLSNSLTTVGDYAFSGNQLTSVTIPHSVSSIGRYAFGANQLVSVTFEANNNIRVIASVAFDNNTNLSGIRLPVHSAPNFVEYFDSKGTVYQPNDEITDFDMAYGAKVPYTLQLDDIAYILNGSELAITDYTNTVEKYIEIPSIFTVNGQEVRVVNIEEKAFSRKQLTSVTLPSSLTSVGNDAFSWNYLPSVVLPNSLTTIGQSAFFNNQFSSVTLPNSVTSIGADAFAWNNITSISLPAVDVIGYNNEVWKDGNSNVVTEIEDFNIDYKVHGDIITYTVTFVDHDNTVLNTETVNHGAAATAPANPTRTGYTFTGWDVPFDKVSSALTVTAQYVIKTYSVRFVNWDNTILKTETVNHGSAATAPANPTRTDHSFTGWDVPFDNVTADLTVTAQYDIASGLETAEQAQFRIYPNPVVGEFTVEGAEGQSLSVYNSVGTLVMQMADISLSQVVNVNHLPKGIYLVKAGAIVHRVVIK